MVEEYVFLPGVFVVAIAAHLSLRSIVWIIVFVTVTTIGQWFCFKQGFDVAGGAFHGDVCSMERMIGIDIMIEGNLDKTLRNMACVALLPEVRFMVVIIPVAGDTCCVHGVAEWIIRMTIVTDQQTMLAQEFERGIPRMIE